MKKIFRFILSLVALFLSGCSRLEILKWDMTPEKWLETHSYTNLSFGAKNIIISEPSSSIIVFLLGIILAMAGIIILRNVHGSKSRKYWGIGLIVWSISTFLAGVSYQAFSYMLKCQGRDVALWTTWWEIWYLILFLISMNIIASAVAFSSSQGKVRKGIHIYAIVNSIIYLVIVLSGSFIPNQFMVSFECMVLFVSPTFIFLLIYNLIQYSKDKNVLEKKLSIAWILMFLVVLIYFVFLLSGLSEVLWTKGIWFNANDVLHIGLIAWVFYYMFFVQKHIQDK